MAKKTKVVLLIALTFCCFKSNGQEYSGQKYFFSRLVDAPSSRLEFEKRTIYSEKGNYMFPINISKKSDSIQFNLRLIPYLKKTDSVHYTISYIRLKDSLKTCRDTYKYIYLIENIYMIPYKSKRIKVHIQDGLLITKINEHYVKRYGLFFTEN